MPFSSSPEIQSAPPDAGQPAPAGPPRRPRAPHVPRARAPHVLSAPRAQRIVRLAAALAGLAAVGAYLVVALGRLDYPFPVEWLESNSLVEVHRILAGQPLYPAPTIWYVPDGYPPLYFAVSAAAASLLGGSYLPLRLVSLVSSLVCFALLGRLVQRETGSAAAGAGAAGLFAATYFVTGTWFDIGRVDSLFLALSISGLYAARWMRGTPGAIAAGALLAAAALTKQTGLAEGVAVIAALLAGPRRRLACVAALAEVAVLGISTLVLMLTTGGWYVFYVFRLMSEHSLTYANFGWFWTALLSALGLAAGAALIGARRVPRVLLAGCAALAVEGYATLVHSGGGLNDMLPAYLAVALLAGLALGGRLPGWASRPAGWASRPAEWASRLPGWAGVAPGVLVLAQTALLLGGFHLSQALPTSADRAVGEQLTAGLRAFGGTVAVPEDPALSLAAGMPPAAHRDAAYDVLRASNQAAIASLRASAADAAAARRFSAIITSRPRPPLGFPATLRRYYRRCPQRLLAGVPAAVFRPADGTSARPSWLWLPRGRSCQAAVSVIDGSVREGHR